MPKSLTELLGLAYEIRDAQLPAENTATRVGTLLVEIIKAYTKPYDPNSTYETGQYVLFSDSIYRVIAVVGVGESPTVSPAKWKVQEGRQTDLESITANGGNRTSQLIQADGGFARASFTPATTFDGLAVIVRNAAGQPQFVEITTKEAAQQYLGVFVPTLLGLANTAGNTNLATVFGKLISASEGNANIVTALKALLGIVQSAVYTLIGLTVAAQPTERDSAFALLVNAMQSGTINALRDKLDIPDEVEPGLQLPLPDPELTTLLDQIFPNLGFRRRGQPFASGGELTVVDEFFKHAEKADFERFVALATQNGVKLCNCEDVGEPDPVVTGILVIGGAGSIAEGNTAQFQLQATYANNSTAIISTGVTWSPSGTGVTTSQTGLVSVAANTTTGDTRTGAITATYQGKTNTKSFAVVDTSSGDTNPPQDSINSIMHKYSPSDTTEYLLVRMSLFAQNDTMVPVWRCKLSDEGQWRGAWAAAVSTQGGSTTFPTEYANGYHWYASGGMTTSNPGVQTVWQWKRSISAPDSEAITLNFTLGAQDFGTIAYPAPGSSAGGSITQTGTGTYNGETVNYIEVTE